MNDIYQTVYFKNDKLGISTLDPTHSLDVSGNAIIRTDLFVNGDTILNSNLIPKTEVLDISNVSQSTLGNSENIWKSSHIRDISVNKIGALFGSDASKNIIVEGNLVPDPITFRDLSNNKNSQFSLGSFNNRWKSLYVSDKTIFIAGSSLGIKTKDVTQDDGSKKTTIELVFVPEAKDEQENTEPDENTPSISIAKGEFVSKTETVIDPNTGEAKQVEVVEPVEDSFAAASLLELADVDISKNQLGDGDKLIYDTEKEKFVIGVKDTVNNSNQTFAEILTQQPQKFTFDSSANSTGSITLNWNYDDILLKDPSLNNMKLTHISSSNLKEGMIPFIDKIHVDISGTTHGDLSSEDNNTWINYNKGQYDSNGDRTISTSDSYDTNSYKQLVVEKTRNPSTSVERILSEAGFPISFRIYGKNNTYDNQQQREKRALYINNMEILTAQPPDIPTFNSESITTKLGLNYTAGLAENKDENSLAKIIEAKINYQEIGREVSQHALASQTNNSFDETQTFSSLNISSNSTISLTVDQNLRKGTKYKYRISAKNNLNENHSSFSDFIDSILFTDIPSSNLGTNLSFSESSTKTNIASNNLNGADRIYINLSAGSDTTTVFSPRVNNSTNTDFQLTSSNFFYGASLDGETDLANIKVFINGDTDASQNAIFNGYDITPGNNSFNNVSNSSSAIDSDDNPFDFVSISSDDIYSNSTNDRGFRLKGNIVMNPIQRKDITSLFGSASNTAKSIKYEYRRDTRIGGSNNIPTSPFLLYVDDFSLPPSMVKVDPTISVRSIIYNMGIPSVHKFDIVFNTSTGDTSRKYTQMNSIYKFVRGDLKIADITINGSNPNITKNIKKDILLSDKEEISSTGVYNLSNTNFASNITSYYQNIQYSSSILTTSNTLTISEKTYSLTTENNGKPETSTTLSMNHFCDRGSFSSFEGSNPTTNAPSNLYQISDISVFGSDMSQFTPVAYTDHTKKVKDSTLLFINNKFRTNENQAYPNISSFTYQNITIDASSGYISSMTTTAYDLDGNQSSDGYKWIGFNFISPNISTDGTTSYLNIYNLLNGYFNSGIMNKIREDNADTVGIVKLGNKIGNLSGAFNPFSIWFNQNTSNKSLNDILTSASHGSAHEKSTTEWGPVLNPSDANINSSGIFIFIGLKNSVSL